MDDNIFDENLSNPHRSSQEYTRDLLLIPLHKYAPQIEFLKPIFLKFHLLRNILLSFHCTPHHYKLNQILDFPSQSASPLGEKSFLLCRYLDEIQHPNIHHTNFENLCHYNWPLDRVSYLDRSLH